MKIIRLLFSILIISVFQLQIVHSQDEKGSHNFKIVGKMKLSSLEGERTVEYDPESPDHLFISFSEKDGKLNSRTQFLFIGKKFNLSDDFVDYINKKEIAVDGTTTFYNKDGSIDKSFVYKKENVVCQNLYYPNGQKKSTIPGTDLLNGEYKMWYPTGQLNFTGDYDNNLKNGDFELFDESGTTIKKGVYREGKLVSGEPVIQDIVYENPEVPAKYNNDNKTIEEFLKIKSGQINSLKNLSKLENIVLLIFIDKTGKITKLDTQGTINPLEFEILNELLKPLPEFLPAKIENIPVDSQLILDLLFSNKGIKLASRLLTQDDKIEKMPEFPGGDMACRKFLATNMRYPEDAMQIGIQGKVYVSFVVEEDGSLTSFKVTKSVSFALDNEAIRVVKSMPKWIPGDNKGKPVRVLYTVPLNFVLQ